MEKATEICADPSCGEPVYCRDFCSRHYKIWWRIRGSKPCTVEGCTRIGRGKTGVCAMHYARMQRLGEYGEGKARLLRGATGEERFWTKVDRRGPRDCWLWQGKIGKRTGYGYIQVQGKTPPVHRFAYELLVGPIPEGLTIDHLCRNRACVNPSHLEAVPQSVNVLRGLRRTLQTHCKHGHEFTPENTIWKKGKWRICRICTQAREAKRLNGWERQRRAKATQSIQSSSTVGEKYGD